MGEMSGVPIEPSSQTKLLDACLAQPGVIGCGVPGGKSLKPFSLSLAKSHSQAGGFDAIWVLVLDPVVAEERDKPMHRVENVWATWTDGSVTPLSATESFDKGVRVEDIDRIPGLNDVIQK